MSRVKYTVSFDMRTTHAAWIEKTFGGHPDFTIEERLAVWMPKLIGRAIAEIKARETSAETRDKLNAGEGGGTLSQEDFQRLS